MIDEFPSGKDENELNHREGDIEHHEEAETGENNLLVASHMKIWGLA